MKVFACSAVLAGALSYPADATVLDFIGGTGTSQVVKQKVKVTWLDDGYRVDWGAFSDLTPTAFQTITSNYPGSAAITEYMTVSGQPFNLTRIKAGLTYEGNGMLAEFYPEGGALERYFFPVLGASLELLGVKADGSTVFTTLASKTVDN